MKPCSLSSASLPMQYSNPINYSDKYLHLCSSNYILIRVSSSFLEVYDTFDNPWISTSLFIPLPQQEKFRDLSVSQVLTSKILKSDWEEKKTKNPDFVTEKKNRHLCYFSVHKASFSALSLKTFPYQQKTLTLIFVNCFYERCNKKQNNQVSNSTHTWERQKIYWFKYWDINNISAWSME